MRKALFVALLFVLVVTVGCSTSPGGAVSAPVSDVSVASAASEATPTSAPTALPATRVALVPTPTSTRVVEAPSATPPIGAGASVTPTLTAGSATPDAANEDMTTPVFVFFYADWCSVCKTMRPQVDQLKTQYSDRIRFIDVNVDEPEGKQAAATYRVWAIPFFVLVKPTGEVAGQWVGQQAEAVFPTAFDDLLKSAGS